MPLNYLLKKEITKQIKEKCYELGFDACGISKAVYLENEAKKLKIWLKNNMHGNMKYMANNFEKRTNPSLLFKNAKSVISVLLNYYPSKKQIDNTFKISKYAYGKDYHFVLKKKLKTLAKFIEEKVKNSNTRIFVDSAPVMDKVWAKRAGLGWIGKNSNLINRKLGSFFFIGEIITDVELEYNNKIEKDYCGDCKKCIDACPTQAIVEPYIVDGSKCISYYTIEYKEDKLPKEFLNKFNDWIFGCDICQDICPWNKFSSPTQEEEFAPNENILSMTKNEWINLSEEDFKLLFKKSAVKRTKYKGLKRNIFFNLKKL